MFYDLENKKVKNAGANWIAPNASIIGDVTLEKNINKRRGTVPIFYTFKKRFKFSSL